MFNQFQPCLGYLGMVPMTFPAHWLQEKDPICDKEQPGGRCEGSPTGQGAMTRMVDLWHWVAHIIFIYIYIYTHIITYNYDQWHVYIYIYIYGFLFGIFPL